MRKLNNKGYLLVEIIVAIVIAMGIAYYLMNLTIRFSEKDEDIYKSITWTNDKNILTNLIMEDVELYKLNVAKKGKDDYSISFEFDDEDIENKELVINRDSRTISYGDYVKKIDSSLQIGEVKLVNGSNYTIVTVPLKSIYSDEDYGLKLFIPYFVEVIDDNNVFDLSGKNNGKASNVTWNRDE